MFLRGTPNKEMWPWRRPGWKSLDLIGLSEEIASVSEGVTKQGNVALDAPRLEKLRFDKFG